MLKHEENSVVSSPPAAQVRVTPEELATALSRIEARKDAGQRHVDGTIPIGEAMQQLGVETTPEEVLAEVQAIRQEPRRAKKRRPSVAERLVLSLGLSGILLGLALGGNSLSQMRSHQAAKPVSISTATPVTSSTPKPITLDLKLLVKTASNKLVMLSEVGDNQPVECNYRSGIFQPSLPNNPLFPWTLFKHDGQVYVRGWIPRMSDQAFRTGTDVSSWTIPGFEVPVTLPVDGFDVVPGAGGDGAGNDTEFHAVNIHLDKYAYGKWQP